jgi:dienelactone hydrolase
MRNSLRAIAFAPLCALAMLAANPPHRLPALSDPVILSTRAPISRAPLGPPNGTYTYELSRNGAPQGATTIALMRRDERDSIETNETGRVGAATARVIASFNYKDLATATYLATYQAPFPRSVPLGTVARDRPHVPFDAATTVRYDVGTDGVRATVDGVSASYVPPAPPVPGQKHLPFVVDAPFMTSVMLVPAFRKRTSAQDLAWYSLAFPMTSGAPIAIASAPMRRVATAPHFEKTPKTALAIAVNGLGTIWFDASSGMVYEAHFDALNLDAHLVAYARAPEPAPPDTPQPLVTPAHIASRAVTIQSGDTTLAGTLDVPATTTGRVPVVVLVPPGPAGDRNYDDDGPQPMFVDVAEAFTARGFAVLRYDPRGTGKDAGDAAAITWEDARDDAEAAIGFAQGDDAIDQAHIFVMGYGNGADLALASAGGTSTVDRVAGAVALAPTTTTYANCARANGVDTRRPTVWQRSTFGHDPTKLAQRALVPLFVLQPGVGVCGETADAIASYDDELRAANPGATIVVASDLSKTFGGRYDADSQADTQMFFPYRFDTSTLDAIADWLAGPHDASASRGGHALDAPARRQTPPPPIERGVPQTGPTPDDVMPGVVTVPSAYLPEPTPAPTTSPVATPASTTGPD